MFLHDNASQVRLTLDFIGAPAAVFDVLPDGLLSLFIANDLFAARLGIRAQDAEGRSLSQLVGENRAQQLDSEFRRCVTETEAAIVECPRGPLGKDVVVPLLDPDGQVGHILWIEVGVAHPSELPAKSTSDIPVGSIELGLLHDMSNLLVPIIGWSEHLGLSGSPDEAREIARTTLMLRSLFDQLRSVLTHSKQSPVHLNLATAFASIEPLLKGVMGPHARIVATIQPRLPIVELVPTQFEQLLLNLAWNARDSMPVGGELRILAERVEHPVHASAKGGGRPRTFASISVSDTGCGMTESVRSQAFEAYVTARKDGRGSGLGLWVVARIVRDAGGEIELDSQPGVGTTVTILLPEAQGDRE